MRRLLASCLVLALAGCAGGDRVTLLPSLDGGTVGAVAVLDPDGEETVLSRANTQAVISRGRVRLREFDAINPTYRDIIDSLPLRAETRTVRFGTASYVLSAEQVRSLQSLLETLADRPGWQVEIAAYTDSVGSEEDNLLLSERRAAAVADQLRGAGFEIEANDVVGRGEYAARDALGDEIESADFRRVDITVR